MAESKPFGKTLTKGSDTLPDIYCNPCYDTEGQVLQAAGFCENCSENLCQDCVSAHKKNKLTRNHQVLDKAGVPQIKGKKLVTAKCNHHEEEVLQSYCRSCDQLCCKICQTVEHHACHMQSLTNAAANIKNCQPLKDLEIKLKALKKGYKDNLSKAATQSLNIEKLNRDFNKDIRKVQEKFETLLNETVKKAEIVKNEDSKKIESVTTACNILVEQIDKISSNLEEMQDNTDNEMLLISMKRAESQSKSFEDRLKQIDTDNTIQRYKFEPIKKLNTMLDELKGEKLSFSHTASSTPMLKIPVMVTDTSHQSCKVKSSTILPNQKLLTIDAYKMVNLINTKLHKIVSALELPYVGWDITRVNANELAITCNMNASNAIQFVSMANDELSEGRHMSVNGQCRGLEYNDRDDTLIVTFSDPPKVEILSLTGTVIKRFEENGFGNKLFKLPNHVALSPDKTIIYVTDYTQNSVTLMTLNGDVKAIYKDTLLCRPNGICVNRFGIVYVVGSNTIHQIVPGSGKLEPLLDEKNGLSHPWTVNYCDVEDKLYVGLLSFSRLIIFKMR